MSVEVFDATVPTTPTLQRMKIVTVNIMVIIKTDAEAMAIKQSIDKAMEIAPSAQVDFRIQDRSTPTK